jgi:hypothetical protein
MGYNGILFNGCSNNLSKQGMIKSFNKNMGFLNFGNNAFANKGALT